MDSTDTLDEGAEATAEFERDLETFLLEAFTNGAKLEGTWEITVPIEAAPDWTIEISKTSTSKTASYDPEFITD